MEKDSLGPDWTLVLAGMEAKAAAWLSAAKSLRAALAAEIGGQSGDGKPGSVNNPTGDQPISIPRGAFHRKTSTEAIKIYLEAAGRKQTNKEIAQALKDGGLESTGNFDNYVTHGLFRLKKDGVVLRFDDGWGLAEWYPESLRNRVAPSEKPPKKKAKGRAKSKKAASVAPKPKAETVTPTPQAAEKVHPIPVVVAKAS